MADVMKFTLRLGVPRGDDFVGMSIHMRITHLTLALAGAIAGGILYVVLPRHRQPPATAEVEVEAPGRPQRLPRAAG